MLRDSKIRLIFWVTLGINLAIAGVKLTFAAVTGSLSLFSDGLHSLLDGGSNVIALVAMRVATRPPDEDHPYGHRKFETLGAIGISVLLILASWEILKAAWGRIIDPVELPRVNAWAMIALAVAVVANLAISSWEHRWGRRLQSDLLLADAKHTVSDALAGLLAILAIMAAYFKYYWLDTLAAIFIVALILRAAYLIVRDSTVTLSDARRLPPEPIRRLVESVEGVENCHMVRSHGPANDVHVDLHIVVDPDLSAKRTFEIENEVMRRIKEEYPSVTEVTIRHQTSMPSSTVV